MDGGFAENLLWTWTLFCKPVILPPLGGAAGFFGDGFLGDGFLAVAAATLDEAFRLDDGACRRTPQFDPPTSCCALATGCCCCFTATLEGFIPAALALPSIGADRIAVYAWPSEKNLDSAAHHWFFLAVDLGGTKSTALFVARELTSRATSFNWFTVRLERLTTSESGGTQLWDLL